VAGVVLAGCVNAKDAGVGAAPATTAPADNGIKDLSAAEIVAKAAQATDGAGSYRVKGEITQEGQRLNADVRIKGKDISGDIAMTQGTAKVMRIGTDLYLQADPALWKIFAGPMAETLAMLFKGKWVKASTTDKQWSEFATIGDVTQMVQTYGTSTITKGELKTVNGMSVIELKEASGVSIFVATVGEPYIVRVEMKGEGELDVTEFGAKVDDIKAPPADQVVDLSGVLGMGK
jgi:hypothetical protein